MSVERWYVVRCDACRDIHLPGEHPTGPLGAVVLARGDDWYVHPNYTESLCPECAGPQW